MIENVEGVDVFMSASGYDVSYTHNALFSSEVNRTWNKRLGKKIFIEDSMLGAMMDTIKAELGDAEIRFG